MQHLKLKICFNYGCVITAVSSSSFSLRSVTAVYVVVAQYFPPFVYASFMAVFGYKRDNFGSLHLQFSLELRRPPWKIVRIFILAPISPRVREYIFLLCLLIFFFNFIGWLFETLQKTTCLDLPPSEGWKSQRGGLRAGSHFPAPNPLATLPLVSRGFAAREIQFTATKKRRACSQARRVYPVFAR